MSFEEYLNINYNENLDDITKFLINDAYKAGVESRQAEINELQKRIKKAEKLMRLFFKEDSYEYAISAHDELKEME